MSLSGDRRLFLRYLGSGIGGAMAASALNPLGPLMAARGPMAFQAGGGSEAGFPDFTPILPTDRDDLVLPAGFDYQVILAWGDVFTNSGERFGYNADWTGFIPRNADGSEGLLGVNHEYISTGSASFPGVYAQTFSLVIGGQPTLDDNFLDQGMSIVHVRKNPGGSWTVLRGSELNRRITARTLVNITGPALAGVREVEGTYGNCSGAQTPWNTFLTCEENFQEPFVPEAVNTNGQGTVGGTYNRNGAYYGWVLEVDPQDPTSIPVKHTSLGRFRHENLALRTSPGRRVIAYEGDDRTDGHVYKFVSNRTYEPGSAANKVIFESGQLYVAVFNSNGTGEWRALAPGTPISPNTGQPMPAIPAGATSLGQVYSGLGAILTDAYRAANVVGGTPTGRPEDIEVHPHDNSVYIAFTASTSIVGDLFENIYGEIWRIVESGDGTGTSFTWQRFATGGPNTAARGGNVFAAPDNLIFDKAGNLWMVTDMSSSVLNSDTRYTAFKNNGIFFIATSGPHAGSPFQFASGPCECEITGPTFTPDERTLFVSIQHPGEQLGIRLSSAMAPQGSNWPFTSFSANEPPPPRPAVVAITRR